MIEIEGMQDIGSQFLLSFKFSSTLIARRKARSGCDAIPAPTTLALIALPMDSAGFRSSGSTRNSDEGQLSRDTRESPLGKLEKIHTSLSFFFSLSLHIFRTCIPLIRYRRLEVSRDQERARRGESIRRSSP